MRSVIFTCLAIAALYFVACLVIQPVSRRSESARIAAATMQIASFQTALGNYKRDLGLFPAQLTDLVQIPEETNRWHGAYLEGAAIPTDPWGRAYVYEYPGKHNTSGYDLSSMGFDGREGTEDDITNWQTGK